MGLVPNRTSEDPWRQTPELTGNPFRYKTKLVALTIASWNQLIAHLHDIDNLKYSGPFQGPANPADKAPKPGMKPPNQLLHISPVRLLL
jgi:hypothetical protein